jgi:hypothetical protein
MHDELKAHPFLISIVSRSREVLDMCRMGHFEQGLAQPRADGRLSAAGRLLILQEGEVQFRRTDLPPLEADRPRKEGLDRLRRSQIHSALSRFRSLQRHHPLRDKRNAAIFGHS